MREIKFRAWDTTKGEMDYCGLERAGGYHECMEHPLMQYTGLKDANGKEIYEGDIVRATDHRNDNKTYILTVEWEQCATSSGWTLSSIGWNQEELEIIGNIYENPELLK